MALSFQAPMQEDRTQAEPVDSRVDEELIDWETRAATVNMTAYQKEESCNKR